MTWRPFTFPIDFQPVHKHPAILSSNKQAYSIQYDTVIHCQKKTTKKQKQKKKIPSPLPPHISRSSEVNEPLPLHRAFVSFIHTMKDSLYIAHPCNNQVQMA